MPSETGGILIGYRAGRDIVVSTVIEIPDPDAHEHGYVRRQGPAQCRLDEFLMSQPSSSLSGWVGDFHSHPTAHPASRQDLRLLRRNARADGQMLALLVTARTNNDWQAYGYLSRGWWVRAVEVEPTRNCK
jgi:integrative and conjugative element protein (TIGR02256 family)